MAATSPSRTDFKMPMPPPQLHLGNENNPPTTPMRSGFTSPSETPQGSPSKKQLPPGARDLPNVFDNAMRLDPTVGSPNKPAPNQSPWNPQLHAPQSPTKGSAPLAENKVNDFRSSVIQDGQAGLRDTKSNQENTPPGMAYSKGSPFTSQAAASRQDLYRPRDEPIARSVPRGLSAADLEKLTKPSVKRLASVTQLCKCQSILEDFFSPLI